MKKKSLALFLSLCLAFSLSSCSILGTKKPEVPRNNVETTTENKTTIEPVETTTEPEETTTGPKETTTGPVETTTGPKETTTGPKETTTKPVETTTGPVETTTEEVPPTTSIIYDEPEYKDFSYYSNKDMEANVNYQMNYKPKDGYVGDIMPYYENGTYYIFYLKDQGSSFNHSIYLVETKDFLHYVDKGEVLKASYDANAQDNWIGTGSVCKVDDTYYFFYTGHNENNSIHERIMVATSKNDLYHFNKLDGVYIDPKPGLSKRDFRDPDVTYDKAKNCFYLTITTNPTSGGAVIVKYTIKKDFSNYSYDTIVYRDTMGFWNLECSDTFKINDTWYLSYSGQDDTLFVAKAKSQFLGYGNSTYGPAVRIEGDYFYAPKAVSNGEDTYFVGWARRKARPDDGQNEAWAGNILAMKVCQREDDSLYLAPIDGLNSYFKYYHKLENTSLELHEMTSKKIDRIYESFMISGDFTFNGKEDFGFILGLNKNDSNLGHIRISPKNNKIEFVVNNFDKIETQVTANLKENTKYHFTLVGEGSIYVLYIDGIASITCRYYGKISSDFGLFGSGSDIYLSNLVMKIRS